MGSARNGGAGWLVTVIDALKVAVVAFVVLQIKEWIDAGALDVPGVLLDALLIAGGVLVVDAVLKLARRA